MMDLRPHTAAADHILVRFRLRARLRVAWLRSLWAERGEPGARGVITHAEADVALAGRDSPAAERAWRRQDAECRALDDELVRLESERQQQPSRLDTLEQIFDLSAAESDVLQAAFAVAADPAAARLCAYLHDDSARPHMSEELAQRLYEHGSMRVATPESGLRRWNLVQLPGDGVVACDPMIRDWLLGHDRLDEPLVGVAALRPPRPPRPRWPVAETAAAVVKVIGPGLHAHCRVQVLGAHGLGRRTFAAAVAAEVGLPLLVVEHEALDESSWAAVYTSAQRQAFLMRCALAWAPRRRPAALPAIFPLEFVITDVPVAAPDDDRVAVDVELPPPSVDEREQLWRELVPAAAQWNDVEVAALAARFRVTVQEVAAIARRGVDTPEQASAVIRESSRGALGDLARWVECPFHWDDLVLPEQMRLLLGELVFEARDRATFWEQTPARRLFPQGRGLFALFAGAPGTGKTMAAQVLAAEIGVELFRISLSSVVSKYVGETSQNLQRILARAEHMDAVLLFDEADALFGKRTEIKDAHDRFANTDTNYLLQAIEAYRGVALLATNKKANIDSAFTRRLRYVIDFPRPDATSRLTLWRRLVGELAGEPRAVALDASLAEAAAVLDTTGAQIKYALLAALFVARQERRELSARHLVRGLERELAKDGRAVSEHERERILAGER